MFLSKQLQIGDHVNFLNCVRQIQSAHCKTQHKEPTCRNNETKQRRRCTPTPFLCNGLFQHLPSLSAQVHGLRQFFGHQLRGNSVSENMIFSQEERVYILERYFATKYFAKVK
jgi:hypothetical protein